VSDISRSWLSIVPGTFERATFDKQIKDMLTMEYENNPKVGTKDIES